MTAIYPYNLYQHPDGHSIDFADNKLTTTIADGESVSIPIGVYGLLLLGDKLEAIAANEKPDTAQASATKGNGLDAINDQPAKTLTKSAAEFIEKCFHPQGFLMGLLTELMFITGLGVYLFIALSLLEVACTAR